MNQLLLAPRCTLSASTDDKGFPLFARGCDDDDQYNGRFGNKSGPRVFPTLLEKGPHRVDFRESLIEMARWLQQITICPSRGIFLKPMRYSSLLGGFCI